jgi:hypothetical protein
MPTLFRTLTSISFSSVLALAGASASAQTTGTLTHNGVTMPVKAAVALLDSSGTDLNIYLMPFVPSAAETALLQKEGQAFLMQKQGPYGRLWLSWYDAADAADAGRMEKMTATLTGENISKPDLRMGRRLPKGFKGSLTGAVKPGEPITFTSSGSDANGSDTVAWDVKVSTKVLPSLEH